MDETILPRTLARHLRDVHTGGNWTASSMRQHLADVTWREAATVVEPLPNTIAVLTYHVHYYVHVLCGVMRGEALAASDEQSFKGPAITDDASWQALVVTVMRDADELADAIERMPPEMLWTTMVDERYGTYYRNIVGTIEHLHYHLGQIVLLKALVRHRG